MMKPFSQACENNKQPILNCLENIFRDSLRILEIGSGTGQHAVFFAEKMNGLFWQTSDRTEYHSAIEQWLEGYLGENLGSPLQLDVSSMEDWTSLYAQQDENPIDGVFTANTAHIMSWQNVCQMFEGVGELLQKGQVFVVYGPFNHEGQFTSPSNAQFDNSLKQQNPLMGIRDDAAVFDLGRRCGLDLFEEFSMPANNRLLSFRKI